MTDQQLRERINRENLERQYYQMFNKNEPTVSRGRQRADKILSVAGDALTVTGSALAIVVAIKQLRS